MGQARGWLGESLAVKGRPPDVLRSCCELPQATGGREGGRALWFPAHPGWSEPRRNQPDMCCPAVPERHITAGHSTQHSALP